MTNRDPIIMHTRMTRRYNLTEDQFSLVGNSMIGGVCSICLDDISSDGLKLSCGHIYHKECIKKWLMKSSLDCPYCRKSVLLEIESKLCLRYLNRLLINYLVNLVAICLISLLLGILNISIVLILLSYTILYLINVVIDKNRGKLLNELNIFLIYYNSRLVFIFWNIVGVIFMYSLGYLFVYLEENYDI